LLEILGDWRQRYGLSAREVEVLFHAALGKPRGLICDCMGCARETLKKHCHNLLRKTGDDWLLEAVARLLIEIIDAQDQR
jgi:DNA-binding CsgD family transcriptional regulator